MWTVHWRKFCGNISQTVNASLYRFTVGDGLLRLRLEVYSSNTENEKFYYIDSRKFDIEENDYDRKWAIFVSTRVAQTY